MHVAMPSANFGLRLLTQSAPKKSVAGTLLKATAAVTVAGSTALYATYQMNEGLRRSMQCTWFCAKLFYEYHGVDDPDEIKKLHEHWAPKSLDFILDLGGYYIKTAQTMVGTGLLPDAYSDAFEILLDRVPPRPFSVIQGVLEAELGCPIEEAFATFERESIGAGSIGQVHRATLHGSGKEVVVKVQYPGVQDTFEMDFKTMTKLIDLFGDYGEGAGEIMENLYQTMENEFDYAKECEYLRIASRNIMPVFGKQVFIPLPVDGDHPEAPDRSLCTHKVMTMEAVRGRPIKKYLASMMEEWARSQNKSVADFKAEMKELYKDPEKLRAMISQSKPVSETMTSVLIAGIKTVNWIFHTNYTVPLNGPRIIRTLCDVHAHQIFVNGMFNSDPHAGNVIMMDDGRLGLIDYGACDSLTHAQRDAFARLCIALADGNDKETIQAFKDFGVSSEKDNEMFLLAYAMMCYHRGFNPDDMNRVGVPEEVGPMEIETYLNKFDHFHKMEGQLLTVQRCSMVLLGLALDMGAGSVSIAQMFKPTAEKYLVTRGLTTA